MGKERNCEKREKEKRKKEREIIQNIGQAEYGMETDGSPLR